MKRFQHWKASIGLAAVIAMNLFGCQGKKAAEVRQVTPSIELNKSRAPIGSPVEVTYRFEVASDFSPIDKDFKVFVHFLDSHNELLFTDDHDLPQPVSSWTAGSTVEYTRTVFIPLYPYFGTASVVVGLYIPETNERLGLIRRRNRQRTSSRAAHATRSKREHLSRVQRRMASTGIFAGEPVH